MSFRVAPYLLPVSSHAPSGMLLYPHQAELWERWDSSDATLLAARTGGGKTRAAMLPVLKLNEWAVAIYPTNELLGDQVRAVEDLARELGFRPLIWTPERWTSDEPQILYSAATHVLVPIDGALLDRWQKVTRCKSRGETLRRVIDPDKPKIVFTNPDILFLILGLQYHADPFEALRRYSTLIIDEFHLYHGVELAHALAMIAIAREFSIFRRLVLLSATPHPEVASLLERAINPTVIGPAPSSEHGSLHTAVHQVHVTPLQSSNDPIDIIVQRLLEMKPELERLRKRSQDDRYIPAVVVVNSVFTAIRLEDRLVEEGFQRDSLRIIRGLSNRAIRQTTASLLAIGTSAIEVGIDFDADYLLFEASEAPSFLQRFGRVGRHRPGKAFAIVPPNAFAGMKELPSVVDRGEFERCVYSWYPSPAVRPWFVTTELGMLSARTLGENLISTVRKDPSSRQDVIYRLRQHVEQALARLAESIGCAKENQLAKATFERAAAGKADAQWVETYRTLNRFRTSLPTIKVHDFREQSKRGEWELGDYEADLGSLLRRGVGLEWNGKLKVVMMRGIGRYRTVHASELFNDDDCGLILATRDYPNLLLYQDGVATPASDLMARENHIFVVVPKDAVQSDLDWRTPVFEAGKYVIAFDGAALLLLELWKRGTSRDCRAKSGEVP
jgi:CRISPR-associated helicase Cas3